MLLQTTSRRSALQWWEHPDRPCKDDPGYADLKLVPNKGDRIDMSEACASCPVYYACLSDLLSHPKAEHYGIRAGIIGLT
jgi:hypothetical protein